MSIDERPAQSLAQGLRHRQRTETRPFNCEECRDTGYRAVWKFHELYEEQVEYVEQCDCKRRRIAASQAETEGDAAKKIAENWKRS